MPTKPAPRRASPYAIAPKAAGASAKASASKPSAKKSARPASKSAPKAARLNSTAEVVGTNLGKLANRLDAANKVVKRRVKKAKAAKPVIGGVRKGHDRGKKIEPEILQKTHAEWKARMKEDRVAHMGIGKKATHSKVPVARRLEFER